MNIYNYIFHCPSLCPCLCKIIYSPHLILALHRETVHSTNNNHIRGWLSRSAFTIPSQQTWQCPVQDDPQNYFSLKKRETKRGWFRKLTNNVRNTPTAWLLTEELPTKDEKQLWTRAADFASNAAAADREEQPHALVKKIHPNLTVIHCINHKAELEVHEGAKSVTGLSPFHTFIDSQTESLVLSSINKDSRLILSTSVGKRGATSCRWCKNALIEAECLFIICLNWQYFVLFSLFQIK